MWLCFEIWSLYVYVTAAIFFVMGETIYQSHYPNTPKEKKRSMRDFINYSLRSLHWFAFNYVMIINPIIFLVVFNDSGTDTTGDLTDYCYVTYFLIVFHIIMFFFLGRIIKLTPIYDDNAEEM